ncbi:MAG: hypothetical protein M0C28_06685 [Candidatus Moduliflexus flocculans]|nr:hypothetical protein [Candidatus Moduliflexus flocculans]
MSFTSAVGESLGIIGPTAAGKSTLARACSPASGRAQHRHGPPGRRGCRLPGTAQELGP